MERLWSSTANKTIHERFHTNFAQSDPEGASDGRSVSPPPRILSHNILRGMWCRATHHTTHGGSPRPLTTSRTRPKWIPKRDFSATCPGSSFYTKSYTNAILGKNGAPVEFYSNQDHPQEIPNKFSTFRSTERVRRPQSLPVATVTAQ